MTSRMGRHVGMSATQEGAAHKIAEKLSQVLETYVDPYSLKLYPARGFWTHNTADVQRFTGSFPRPDLPKLSYSLGSWDCTLSRIAKGNRFVLRDNREDRKACNDFDIFLP